MVFKSFIAATLGRSNTILVSKYMLSSQNVKNLFACRVHGFFFAYFKSKGKEASFTFLARKSHHLTKTLRETVRSLYTLFPHIAPLNGYLTPGRTNWGGGCGFHPALRFFYNFFLANKTSAKDVFSSCSFIPKAHFETSLVMISYYSYEGLHK